MIAKGATQRTQISDDMYAVIERKALAAMDSAKCDYEAVVMWLEDAKGNMVSASKYCSCTSGSCSKSGNCANGDITCDCVNCTFSCS